uniref:Coatomer subunit delta n=1 Tax=Odontella aurita TaxID=265563 RepID=A0A7S4NFN2_9STRA|mmetsp:Transcript_63225/g.186924  ORF Transcript_63225/g.186924 Transcript_63225/m.186924 type:complete len:543 (+) Transcript_63225:228-1856(+)|eukprot:CAMPEP_0113541076 /NCGR_PEP_ID=MMETSP0015_2-20120614/8831_1 /TAXON_ID=2838 /ORGANISM="Odontella" /LENGTH=542 /DNA_ID=CAMNT_0000440943 /DNA_START=188 /DNA_END=1816 /DNA_ORIENTATION=- /assembly_acc=CAM_ASM_000160
MVVLSASICSGQGKALVSRQFVEMNRMRVEGLFAAFPKLVGHAKQHTFVETDTVRYVYQPLENNLYLLLITTKTSNIVEDLGTLRLLAKVVPDVAGSVAEAAINDHAFELIFSFDEVLTAGGYKEEATLSSIRTNLLMDSHEEKMHIMLMESKKAEAAEQMKKRQKDIRERQMQAMKQNFMNNGVGGGPGMPSGGMEGFGGGGGGPAGGFAGFGSDSAPPPGGFDYGKPAEPEPVDEGPKVIAKGMSLGGVGKKKDNMMAAMAAEDNLGSLLGGGAKGGASDLFGLGTATAAPAAAPSTPLSLVLEEKLTVSMNREGGIESAEVKGNLTLTANTDDGAKAIVAVNRPEIAAKCTTDWSFATHPKVDKRNYEKTGNVALKGGKGFPVGRPVGVLKWSYSAEDAAPITINCWPEDDGSGGVVNVNIEFELNRTDMVLRDVNIVLPLGTTDPPAIEAIDGEHKHDPARGMLCWHHDVVDESNPSGSLEFTVPGSDVDAFFPVQVMFKSDTLYCPIEILNVTSSANGASLPNEMSKGLVPETYLCV